MDSWIGYDENQRGFQCALAAARANVKSNHRDLLYNIERLESLYMNAYLGDGALQRISQNVFMEARRILNDTAR